MIQKVWSLVLTHAVLLDILAHRGVFCQLFAPINGEATTERQAQQDNEINLKIKRFIFGSDADMESRSKHEYEYLSDFYDAEEMTSETAAPEKSDYYASNFKPMKTTTSSDNINPLIASPSPLPTKNKQSEADVNDCCVLLRMGYFEEFELCQGDRCLAPNTCDGPEILENCFFDGKYYPVDSTMHIDEAKCFVVKCIKSNGRGPPTAQINDFGTNCCKLDGQLHRDGAKLELQTCQNGHWTSQVSVTPTTGLTSATTTLDDTTESTASVELTIPSDVTTSSTGTVSGSTGISDMWLTSASITLAEEREVSTQQSGIEEMTGTTEPTQRITDTRVEVEGPPQGENELVLVMSSPVSPHSLSPSTKQGQKTAAVTTNTPAIAGTTPAVETVSVSEVSYETSQTSVTTDLKYPKSETLGSTVFFNVSLPSGVTPSLETQSTELVHDTSASILAEEITTASHILLPITDTSTNKSKSISGSTSLGLEPAHTEAPETQATKGHQTPLPSEPVIPDGSPGSGVISVEIANLTKSQWANGTEGALDISGESVATEEHRTEETTEGHQLFQNDAWAEVAPSTTHPPYIKHVRADVSDTEIESQGLGVTLRVHISHDEHLTSESGISPVFPTAADTELGVSERVTKPLSNDSLKLTTASATDFEGKYPEDDQYVPLIKNTSEILPSEPAVLATITQTTTTDVSNIAISNTSHIGTTEVPHRDTTGTTDRDTTDTTHRDTTDTTHRDTTDTTHRDTTDTTHRDITDTTHRDTTDTTHRDTTDTSHRDITDTAHRDTTDTSHRYTTDTYHRDITDTAHVDTTGTTDRGTTDTTHRDTTDTAHRYTTDTSHRDITDTAHVDQTDSTGIPTTYTGSSSTLDTATITPIGSIDITQIDRTDTIHTGATDTADTSTYRAITNRTETVESVGLNDTERTTEPMEAIQESTIAKVVNANNTLIPSLIHLDIGAVEKHLKKLLENITEDVSPSSHDLQSIEAYVSTTIPAIEQVVTEITHARSPDTVYSGNMTTPSNVSSERNATMAYGVSPSKGDQGFTTPKPIQDETLSPDVSDNITEDRISMFAHKSTESSYKLTTFAPEASTADPAMLTAEEALVSRSSTATEVLPAYSAGTASTTQTHAEASEPDVDELQKIGTVAGYTAAFDARSTTVDTPDSTAASDEAAKATGLMLSSGASTSTHVSQGSTEGFTGASRQVDVTKSPATQPTKGGDPTKTSVAAPEGTTEFVESLYSEAIDASKQVTERTVGYTFVPISIIFGSTAARSSEEDTTKNNETFTSETSTVDGFSHSGAVSTHTRGHSSSVEPTSKGSADTILQVNVTESPQVLSTRQIDSAEGTSASGVKYTDSESTISPTHTALASVEVGGNQTFSVSTETAITSKPEAKKSGATVIPATTAVGDGSNISGEITGTTEGHTEWPFDATSRRPIQESPAAQFTDSEYRFSTEASTIDGLSSYLRSQSEYADGVKTASVGSTTELRGITSDVSISTSHERQTPENVGIAKSTATTEGIIDKSAIANLITETAYTIKPTTRLDNTLKSDNTTEKLLHASATLQDDDTTPLSTAASETETKYHPASTIPSLHVLSSTTQPSSTADVIAEHVTKSVEYDVSTGTPEPATASGITPTSVTDAPEPPDTVSPEYFTTEPSTAPPDEYPCRWDNMTVSSSGTMLRDPARCLHVECWHTVYGAFIDVTIVHEARGCCELQNNEMVPPGYVISMRGGRKKRCIFGRWHTQYLDAAKNLTKTNTLPFKNKTYHFFPRMTPIDEALTICERINGTLAVPDNREQELELGELGAEGFGGQVTFYVNQDKIQQHVMNAQNSESPHNYIVYPHDTRKMTHINVNKPDTDYAVESFVEDIKRLSVPICENGGAEETIPEYFNNLVSIGTLTEQGLPREAAYWGMEHDKNTKILAKMREWRLPPVPSRFRNGHSNIGKELRRWGQVHKDLAYAIKHKEVFKDPFPVYKANYFNEK